MQVRADENFAKCGCGRSPTGMCIGWHSLSEQAWIEGKTQMLHNFKAGHGKTVIETEENPWGDDE